MSSNNSESLSLNRVNMMQELRVNEFKDVDLHPGAASLALAIRQKDHELTCFEQQEVNQADDEIKNGVDVLNLALKTAFKLSEVQKYKTMIKNLKHEVANAEKNMQNVSTELEQVGLQKNDYMKTCAAIDHLKFFAKLIAFGELWFQRYLNDFVASLGLAPTWAWVQRKPSGDDEKAKTTIRYQAMRVIEKNLLAANDSMTSCGTRYSLVMQDISTRTLETLVVSFVFDYANKQKMPLVLPMKIAGDKTCDADAIRAAQLLYQRLYCPVDGNRTLEFGQAPAALL